MGGRLRIWLTFLAVGIVWQAGKVLLFGGDLELALNDYAGMALWSGGALFLHHRAVFLKRELDEAIGRD